MIKRILAACCWFVAVTWAYNYLGFYLGLPQLAGLVIAAAVGAFVGIDPAGVLWPDEACTVRDEAPVQAAESTTVASAT